MKPGFAIAFNHLIKFPFEEKCISYLESSPADAAHDIAHTARVVASSLDIIDTGNQPADEYVVRAAAWLHDCVVLPKNHPDRTKASALAALKATEFLSANNFPGEKLDAVAHAIEAHSFSAGITPQSLEAEIVQDADRMDALGAIGIARCFMIGGVMGSAIYNPDDPFCDERQPDDKTWSIDHFYTKLLKLPETMNTEAGKQVARKRARFMKTYLKELSNEISAGR